MKKNRIMPLLLGATLTFSALWVASCQKAPISEPVAKNQNFQPMSFVDSTYVTVDSNFITSSEAEKYAERITPEVFRGGDNKSVIREIQSTMTLSDKNGIPAMYIFNYKYNKGYIIMSADFRYEPICAFVENGNITASDVLPSALTSWMGLTMETIEGLRDGEITGTGNENYISWKLITGAIYLQELPRNYIDVVGRISEINCNPYNYYTKEALIQTQWNQGCGYNNMVPVGGCSDNCGFAPTGCVAVSGSQIAKYWAMPNSGYNFDYAGMPNNPPFSGNSEIQRLMYTVGSLVNMQWSCGSSSASSEDLAHMFQYYFYYSAPGEWDDYENSNRWTIKSDIDQSRPVVLNGCDDHSDFLWWTRPAGNCHSWICDGYRLSTSNCYSGRFHFHMNWGWGGNNDGYFYQSEDWPVNAAYQFTRHFLHNIHP